MREVYSVSNESEARSTLSKCKLTCESSMISPLTGEEPVECARASTPQADDDLLDNLSEIDLEEPKEYVRSQQRKFDVSYPYQLRAARIRFKFGKG